MVAGGAKSEREKVRETIVSGAGGRLVEPHQVQRYLSKILDRGHVVICGWFDPTWVEGRGQSGQP